MDWSTCKLVEIDPNRQGGAPVLVGTRLPADTIVVNYEGGSPVDEIAENFDISEDTVRSILNYAYQATRSAA